MEEERSAKPPAAARRTGRLSLAAWLAAGLVVAGLLVYGFGFQGRLPGGVSGASSAAADDFQLALLEPFEGQGQVSLSGLLGRPVIVNFWASWCGPCRAEMPLLERVWQRYRERGLVVVGVTVEDTERDARAFLEAMGVTYPVGLDADGSIARAYQVQTIPFTVFVTERGTVARRWVGLIREDILESGAVELLR